MSELTFSLGHLAEKATRDSAVRLQLHAAEAHFMAADCRDRLGLKDLSNDFAEDAAYFSRLALANPFALIGADPED